MADAPDSDLIDNETFAKSMVDLARAQPDKAAAFGQAFVHAGIQLVVDELGGEETAAWLRKLASIADEVAAQKRGKAN